MFWTVFLKWNMKLTMNKVMHVTYLQFKFSKPYLFIHYYTIFLSLNYISYPFLFRILHPIRGLNDWNYSRPTRIMGKE